jgi:hypothetical protein
MQYPRPTLLINVFRFDGRDMPLESHGVCTGIAEAVRRAEEFADEYRYTLTDAGVINLTTQFSEGWQDRKDFDAAVDAKIDGMREREA